MPRNDAIDSLRGLAVALVVFHHLAIRLPLSHTALAAIVPGRLLAALCWNGSEAVFIFFVLSGFLIATTARARWGRLTTPRPLDFWRRRAVRILPPLAALLIVLALLDRSGLAAFTIDRARQSLGAALAHAFTFTLNAYEGRTGYLPGNWDVLWSLSIEEQFYLAFPLVCALAARAPRTAVAALALLALSLPITRAAATPEIWQEKATLPGMAAIATGILAALLAARWRPRPRAARALALAGAAGIAAVLLIEDWLWPTLGEATLLLLTIGTALVLLALHGRAPPAIAPLSRLGRLSYEVYLTHMFVVFGLLALWRALSLPDRAGFLLYPAALGLAGLLGAVVSAALSAVAGRKGKGGAAAPLEPRHSVGLGS